MSKNFITARCSHFLDVPTCFIAIVISLLHTQYMRSILKILYTNLQRCQIFFFKNPYFLNFFQYSLRIFPRVRIFSLVDIRPLFPVLLLPKVPIVLTYALNKNCIKLNFLKRSQWAHVFTSSRSGARGTNDLSILR